MFLIRLLLLAPLTALASHNFLGSLHGRSSGSITNPKISTILERGTSGIGGFDFKVAGDEAIAFDYESKGHADHLLLYRPGAGAAFIVRPDQQGSMVAIYKEGAGGAGIGGFDLKLPQDKLTPFDYDGSGKADHLLATRGGGGVAWVLKRNGDKFEAIWKSTTGVGGYDLRDANDQIFALDYASTGKLDHLCFYRPGTGAIFIVNRGGQDFTAVYKEGAPGKGIGGYNLMDKRDRAFALDYTSSGRLDHIALYRPGLGTFWVVSPPSKNGGTTPQAVFSEGAPGKGIGGFALSSDKDRALAYDFAGTGKADHILLYSPGASLISILQIQISGPSFVPKYQEIAPGPVGLGGMLDDERDRIVPLEYYSNGTATSLLVYRPGAGNNLIVAPERASSPSPATSSGTSSTAARPVTTTGLPGTQTTPQPTPSGAGSGLLNAATSHSWGNIPGYATFAGLFLLLL